MSKRNAAVALAKMGFLVFPVESNGKKPIIDNWTERAISDPKRVHDWWTEATGEERDYNIGVCCNNLLVVDIDTKGGDNPNDVLAKMEKEHGALPVVSTPSGGYHAYFRLPEGVRVGNTAKRFGPTVDTRSWHGYVLGPGSDINGNSYSWVVSTADGNVEPGHISDLPLVPASYIEGSERPKDKAPVDHSIEWDTPAAIAKATNYIKDDAPSAEKGSRGITAYRIACRCRDYAVSESAALTLMADGWNVEGRVDPPMSIEELVESVEHAYAYAQNAPVSPGSEFDPADSIGNADAPKKSLTFPFEPLADFEEADLPKRRWIIPGLVARTFLTVLASAPGAGKTQLLSHIAIAAAANNPDVIGRPIEEPTAVWFFNAEDDMTELKRRIAATLKRYKLRISDFPRKLAVASGTDHPFSIATYDKAKGQIVVSKAKVDHLIKTIKENGVGLFVADPLTEMHGAPENDNDAMKIVTAAFRRVAQEADCAVLIAAHTRKAPGTSSDGIAGNQDTLRGAGAQAGVARIVLTLANMTAREAKASGVKEENRSSYQRIDVAKGNIMPAQRGAAPEWFKWENVALENGDHVGVLVKSDLAGSRLKREDQIIETIADIVATAAPDGGFVSWPKVVRPRLMEREGVSESMARKWLEDMGGKVETATGTLFKTSKTGAGGALLRFAADSLVDEQPGWLY